MLYKEKKVVGCDDYEDKGDRQLLRLEEFKIVVFRYLCNILQDK